MIQTSYSNLGTLTDHQEMESALRGFLRASFRVEDDRDIAESADVFSHLEIKSLMLLRSIKKLNKGQAKSSGDKCEGQEPPAPKRMNVRKVKVKFINPKKQIPKKAYKCPHCEFTSASMNVKSLQNHIKDLHPNLTQVSENDFPVDNQESKNTKIECLLIKKNGAGKCGQFFTSDQLKRHLRAKKLHNIVPEIPKGQEFKGWRIIGEKVEIVCGLPSEVDPPSEEEQDIEEAENSTNQSKVLTAADHGKKRKATKEDGAVGSSFLDSETAAKKPKLDSPEPIQFQKDQFHDNPDQNANLVASESDDPKDAHDVEDSPPEGLEGISFQIIPNPHNSGITIVNITPVEGIREDENSSDFTSTCIQDKLLPSAAIESADQILMADRMDFPSQSGTIVETDLLNSIDPRLVLDTFGATTKDDDIETSNNNSSGLRELDNQKDASSSLADDDRWKKLPSTQESVPIPNKIGSPVMMGQDSQKEVNSQDSSLTPAPANNDGDTTFLASQVSVTREDLPAALFRNVADKVCTRKTVTVKSFNPTMKNGEIWSKKESPKKPNIDKAPTAKEDEDEEEEEEENLTDSEGDSDSDYYDENLDTDAAITRIRHERRKVRWMQRASAEKATDLTEVPENKVFISAFKSWLTEKTSLKTTNKDCSTFDLSMSHGFYYVDSYLNFMTSKNPEFTLSRLVAFKDKKKFLLIESPVLWISTAAGQDKTSNPVRQKEQLKFHKGSLQKQQDEVF